MSAYAELETRFGRIARIGEANAILHWDRAAMMPCGGAAARAEQVAVLEMLRHELINDARVGELLDAAEASVDREELDSWQRANLLEMRRAWVHETAVPPALVEALTRTGQACEMIWRRARPQNDFGAVAPALAEVLKLVREMAEAKASALGCSPYDALLDQYEPGGNSARIDALFDDLAAFLPEFTAAVLEHQAAEAAPLRPRGPFPVARQQALGRRMMATAGFDFDRGRLDVSTHPFCGGVPDDVRITTRYDEADFAQALTGVMHETGHALYELGLPAKWRYQPVGSARGMSVHESQSLLIEMQVCRGRSFLEYATPIIAEALGGHGPAWSVDNFARLFTRVERSLIRVDADEVTYPAHVVLRYRLEKAMIAGDLEVAGLPSAWREGMRQLVGVEPPDDRDGCMQDIHWMDGIFGYFPTYTLGAMTAAQFYDAARRQDGDIEPGVARGDFRPLLAWLRTHVHDKASSLSTDALIREATGRPLDVGIYEAHLRRRYLDNAP